MRGSNDITIYEVSNETNSAIFNKLLYENLRAHKILFKRCTVGKEEHIRLFSIKSNVNVKFIILCHSDPKLLLKFFNALSDAITNYGSIIAKQYGISLGNVSKVYAKGLSRVDDNLALKVKMLMNEIRSSINNMIIISSNDFSTLNAWLNDIKWKIVGLLFTDAKLHDWIKGLRITFGTTDPYGAATFLSQVRVSTMYVDYYRYTSQGPKPAMIFTLSSKLLETICSDCVPRFKEIVSHSRVIFNTVRKEFEGNTKVKGHKIMESLNKILEIADRASDVLIHDSLIPADYRSIAMFIGSLISYDGYIHGNVLVLTRNLQTLKGVIVESLLKALEKTKPMDLLLGFGEKYIQEVSLYTSKKLRKYVMNEIDHIRKRELLSKMMKETQEVKLQELVDRINHLNESIEKVSLISWHDRKYPDSHGYRLMIYLRNPLLADMISNMLMSANIHVQRLQRSRIIKVMNYKPQLTALLLLINKVSLNTVLPNYKRKALLWNYLIELCDSLDTLKEILIRKGLWNKSYDSTYNKITRNLLILLKRLHHAKLK